MAMKINIQLTQQQQQMLGAGAILLVVGGFMYYKYFWAPISVRIADAQSKIEDMESKIEKAKSQAGRLSRIQHELEVLNQAAADAEKRLPKDRAVPDVVDAIGAIAHRNRILLNTFSPGAVSQKQYFTEVPYIISVSGSYHDIGRFFASIALEERIFNVRNVTFAVGGPSDKSGQSLTVNFMLVSYQYKG